MSRRRVVFAAVALALTVMSPVGAHELWLEPTSTTTAPGGRLEAEIRIGQMLEGPNYSFLPSWFERFDVISDGAARPVAGFVGDLPAVGETAGGAGLTTLVYLSTPDTLDYETFGKFLDFARKEGLDGAEDRHRARGLPEENFRETYVRSAKALIAVGDGAGDDAPVGLPYEFVVETNPFTTAAGRALQARLLWEGAARPGAQVSVFRRAPDGTVAVERLRTDADGRVRFAAPAGFYLLSAVRLVEPPPKLAREKAAVWHTLWASATFHRP